MSYRRPSEPTGSVDLSFLNEEEKNLIGDVLERNKKLCKMDEERVKELKNKNQDTFWLKRASGQWFEEIRKGKFQNQEDLNKIVNVSLFSRLKKKTQTALGEFNLRRLKNYPPSKNGISHIISSDNSSGNYSHAVLPDPFKQEPLTELSQYIDNNLLLLHPTDMAYALEIQLKTSLVPRPERKIFVHRAAKDKSEKDNLKLFVKEFEIKTISAVVDQRHENLEIESLATSEITAENVRSHNFTRLHGDDNEINKLPSVTTFSGDFGPLFSVRCSVESEVQTPCLNSVHITTQQGNRDGYVEASHCITDPATLSNSATGRQCNANIPTTDHILIRNRNDRDLSNSKHETTRTLTLSNLPSNSQDSSVVAFSAGNTSQSYSTDNISETSNRDESYLESSLSDRGPSSLPLTINSIFQKNVPAGSVTDSLICLQGRNSQTRPGLQAPLPVNIQQSTLFPRYSTVKWHINSIHPVKTTSQKDSSNNSLRSSQSQSSNPSTSSCATIPPRIAPYSTTGSKGKLCCSLPEDSRKAFLRQDNIGALQNSTDRRERLSLLTTPVISKPFSSSIRFNKSRLKTPTLGNTRAPLWKSNDDNLKQNASLPIEAIGSEFPSRVQYDTVSPNRPAATLQLGGDGYAHKGEIAKELSTDRSTEAQFATNATNSNKEVQRHLPSTVGVPLETESSNDTATNERHGELHIHIKSLVLPSDSREPSTNATSGKKDNLEVKAPKKIKLALDKSPAAENIPNQTADLTSISSAAVPEAKQQLPPNLGRFTYSKRNTSLRHSLFIDDMNEGGNNGAEISQSRINSELSSHVPLTGENSATDVSGMNKNASQDCSLKVNRMYTYQRPPEQHTFRFLRKTNSVPTSPPLTIRKTSPSTRINTLRHSLNSGGFSVENDIHNHLIQLDKAETSLAPSSPESVSSQQSSTTVTEANKSTSPSYSLTSSAVAMNRGDDKYLHKDKPEVTSESPSPDPPTEQESTVNNSHAWKSTSQNHSPKLTYIYRDRKPSTRFNYKFLHKTNSRPAMSNLGNRDQFVTDVKPNIEDESLSHLPLSDHITMDRETSDSIPRYKLETDSECSSPVTLTGQLSQSNKGKSLSQFPVNSSIAKANKSIKGIETSQYGNVNAVLSSDRKPGQQSPTNITQDNKILSQNSAAERYFIMTDRGTNKDYIQQDTLSLPPLDQASSSLLPTKSDDIIEAKPPSHALNNAGVAVVRESPGYFQTNKSETPHVFSAPVKVSAQHCTTSISAVHKTSTLRHSLNSAAFNMGSGVSKDHAQQDKAETSHAPFLPDPVTRQSLTTVVEASKSKSPSYSLTSSTSAMSRGDDEYLHKDKPEVISESPSPDPPTEQESAVNNNHASKSTSQNYSSNITEIYQYKYPYDRYNLKFLRKTNSVPTLPVGQHFSTDVGHSKINKSPSSLPIRDHVTVYRTGDYLHRYQTKTHSESSSPESPAGPKSPTNSTHNNKGMTLIHSPKSLNVTVDRGSNEYKSGFQRSSSVSISPSPDSLNDPESASQNTNSVQSTLQNHSSTVKDINHGWTSREGFGSKYLIEENSAASTPPTVKCLTGIRHSNKEDSLGLTVNDDIAKGRGISDYLPRLEPETNSELSPPGLLIAQCPDDATHSTEDTSQNHLSKNIDITLDLGSNEYLQKEHNEIIRVPPSSGPLPGQEAIANSDNIIKTVSQNYSSKLKNIYRDRPPRERFNFDGFQRSYCPSLSPPMRTKQRSSVDNTEQNRDKALPHSPFSDQFTMDKTIRHFTGSGDIPSYKDEIKSEPSSPKSPIDQHSPTVSTKSNRDVLLRQSPVSGGIAMGNQGINYVRKTQGGNSNTLLSPGSGPRPWSPTNTIQDTNKKNIFQNWEHNNGLERNNLRCIEQYNSEDDISLLFPDQVTDYTVVSNDMKKKELRKTPKIGGFTFDSKSNNGYVQNYRDVISGASLSSNSRIPSPEYFNKNVSLNSRPKSIETCSLDYHYSRKSDKILRHKRTQVSAESYRNEILSLRAKDTDFHNSLQQSSEEVGKINSDIMINNIQNRFHTYNPRCRRESSGTDENSNSLVTNDYQSKSFSRLKGSFMVNLRDEQTMCSKIYRSKSLKNINSDYDYANYFHDNAQIPSHSSSTNSFQRSTPVQNVQNQQANTSHQFCNLGKSSILNKPSLEKFKPIIGNKVTTHLSDNSSKKKKETNQDNVKSLSAGSKYIHEDIIFPVSSDDVSTFSTEANQEMEMFDEIDYVPNEYFPVDIKTFWPKENPADIMRLFSSSPTGSRKSEECISPQHLRSPAVVYKDVCVFSDTTSDTTTDDEYFLEAAEPVKESSL